MMRQREGERDGQGSERGVRNKEVHVYIDIPHIFHVHKETNDCLQMDSHFARVEERLLVEFLSALQNLLLRPAHMGRRQNTRDIYG